LIRGYSFNHFGLLIITFGSFSTDVLTNFLILGRFVNNILNRLIHLDKRRGREAALFPKGWTLFRESWTSLLSKEGWTTSSFPEEGWILPREG
jgi:hypothetical protein